MMMAMGEVMMKYGNGGGGRPLCGEQGNGTAGGDLTYQRSMVHGRRVGLPTGSRSRPGGPALRPRQAKQKLASGRVSGEGESLRA
jgi:hypothetical protein